jgi:hypothetical protein
MLTTVNGTAGPDTENTDSEQRERHLDEPYVPDFFDHWMEEYASSVRQAVTDGP